MPKCRVGDLTEDFDSSILTPTLFVLFGTFVPHHARKAMPNFGVDKRHKQLLANSSIFAASSQSLQPCLNSISSCIQMM